RATEGPFSSTTTELLTLAAAVAMVPREKRVTVFTGLQVVMKLPEELLDKKDVQHRHQRSNIAFLAMHVCLWFQNQIANMHIVWVMGQSGVPDNEKADQAVESAQQSGPWVARL
ncbi:hypothetical protein GGF37_003040, partial [Kickxella alabastrina]